MNQRFPPPHKLSFSFSPIKVQPPASTTDPRLAAVNGLVAQGKWSEAETAARAIVAVQPTNAGAWKVLAAVLLTQGKDALKAAQQAVALMPKDPLAVCNLGRAFHDRGQLTEAMIAYRHALALRPGLIHALLNLGAALRESGDLDQSEACLREAIRLQPQSATAHNDLGVTLTTARKLDAAFSSLRQALAIDPNHVMAMVNLGHALNIGHRHDLAAAAFDRALGIDPEHAQAHLGRANALRELGMLEESEAAFHATLVLQPRQPAAHAGLAICLVQQGRAVEALQHYETAQLIERNDIGILPGMMFARQYLSEPDAQEELAEARRFGEAASQQAQRFHRWEGTPDPTRRLRVGFVSGDLRKHPVGHFLEAVLGALSASHGQELELIAYHNHWEEDELSKRIEPAFTRWHRVHGWRDAQLAQQIHADHIDVLIDLAGHTTHNRLTVFAWKPAPVQVSWLGYFATTGIAEMDYVLADTFSVPPESESRFTESVWHLPHTRLCFTPPVEAVNVSTSPASASGQVTFGCFNHLGKLNPTVIATWSEILHQCPKSRLLIKARQLDEAGARERIAQRFAAEGIPAERLLLEGASPKQQYLETHHRVDIVLDPFPYTGGTTTVEALWMGVPVITLAGSTMLSRQGLSLLQNAGLADWVANDREDYVRKALAFANNTQALDELRQRLRGQVLSSPLFDAPGFATHFSSALRGMWTRYCGTSC